MAEVNSIKSCREMDNSNMLNFITKWNSSNHKENAQTFSKHLFDRSKDLYRKDLTAHYGCVNAIEFSNDGDLLFSGGDDRRVLVWNVNRAMMYYTGKLGDGAKPTIMRMPHASNIFCLAVDNNNKRILSGGNDEQVILHDCQMGHLVDCFPHDSPVFALSVNPSNCNIFASAADKGIISIYDIRQSNTDPLILAKLKTPFHSVMFHPLEPSLIATANSKVGVHIWDMRKPKEILQECSADLSMSVRWNSSGTYIFALRHLLPPVLFDPMQPKRCLQFDSPSYYNACTMKSCCFAGDSDEFVVSGSDDFNLYMWKVPDPWPESGWVDKAHMVLAGHRSIVNQVRYATHKQLLVTSGVEKIIKIWSPFHLPYSDGDRDQPYSVPHRLLCSSRACSRGPGLISHGPAFLSHDYSQESVDEDKRMIHFFDSLLRNELHTPSTGRPASGKLYPIGCRKKESKRYEDLIERKKKHLLRVLVEKERNVCCLSPGAAESSSASSKRYHFSLEERKLVSASESEEEPSNEAAATGPSSRSSSSSSVCSQSDSLKSRSDNLDYELRSELSLSPPDPGRQSDSSSSPRPSTSRAGLDVLKDSGIHLSSSDSDHEESTFKRKRVSKRRCYRNCKKRIRSSSESSEEDNDITVENEEGDKTDKTGSQSETEGEEEDYRDIQRT